MRFWAIVCAVLAATTGCDQLDGLTDQLQNLENELVATDSPPAMEDAIALAERARMDAERAAQEAEARVAEAPLAAGPDGSDSPAENAERPGPSEPGEDTAPQDDHPGEPPTPHERTRAGTESGPAVGNGRPTAMTEPGRSGSAQDADPINTGGERPPGREVTEGRRPSAEPNGSSPSGMRTRVRTGGDRPGCGDTPDPPQCVIDRYHGRARHAYQIIALVDAYNAKGRFADAVPQIQQLLQRYPTHARADRYRQLLRSRGVEPAR